jgi:lauroyl/myristoyl acyltransferase
MGALGVMQLVALLLGVAVVAALCGYLGSAIARRKRNKRRARNLPRRFPLWLSGWRDPA